MSTSNMKTQLTDLQRVWPEGYTNTSRATMVSQESIFYKHNTQYSMPFTRIASHHKYTVPCKVAI